MAHEIENRDLQVGIEQAWHGRTIVVPVVTQELAFPYEIERVPAYGKEGDEFVPLEGVSYFRCSDDGKRAGKCVADTYIAITNGRFWEIVMNSVGGAGAVVESAGTIKDRSRRFITVKLNSEADSFKIGNREFKQRLSFLDSIDGSTNLYGVNTSTCVVCANTFRVAMLDKSGAFQFKIRHTKNMVAAIENMEQAIDVFCGVTAQFKAALVQAESIPVKPATAREAFAGFLGGENGGKLSTRSFNTVGRLTALFNGGAGNRGETLLDAVSAITDFYSHESSGGEDKPGFRAKQAFSSEYGAGANSKEEFFNEIFAMPVSLDGEPTFKRDSWDAMVARGRSILARTESVSVN